MLCYLIPLLIGLGALLLGSLLGFYSRNGSIRSLETKADAYRSDYNKLKADHDVLKAQSNNNSGNAEDVEYLEKSYKLSLDTWKTKYEALEKDYLSLRDKKRESSAKAAVMADLKTVAKSKSTKGRGRPAGSKNKTKTTAAKRRGRPAGSKNKTKATATKTAAKRRGRPAGSKNKTKATATKTVAKRRGRPAGSKNKTRTTVAPVKTAAKRRGRPAGSKNKTKTTKAVRAKTTKRDDLTLIEGIGPKMDAILKNSGIRTFSSLSKAKTTKLKKILEKQGPRYRMYDPSTWAQQASYASKGQMKKLQNYQDKLDRGRKK